MGRQRERESRVDFENCPTKVWSVGLAGGDPSEVGVGEAEHDLDVGGSKGLEGLLVFCGFR